jgi:TM2 domain-containing membrane protein YozV
MDKQDGRFIVTQVAVGWVLLLLIKVFSFSAAILFSIYENNGFQSLAGDPGPDAARIFLYVFWIVSLMPIYVFLVAQRAKGWRWPSLILSVLFLLFGLLHHWHHWSDGERQGFSSNVIDFMNHCVAIWLVFTSARWAKVPAHLDAVPDTSAFIE